MLRVMLVRPVVVLGTIASKNEKLVDRALLGRLLLMQTLAISLKFRLERQIRACRRVNVRRSGTVIILVYLLLPRIMARVK